MRNAHSIIPPRLRPIRSGCARRAPAPHPAPRQIPGRPQVMHAAHRRPPARRSGGGAVAGDRGGAAVKAGGKIAAATVEVDGRQGTGRLDPHHRPPPASGIGPRQTGILDHRVPVNASKPAATIGDHKVLRQMRFLLSDPCRKAAIVEHQSAPSTSRRPVRQAATSAAAAPARSSDAPACRRRITPNPGVSSIIDCNAFMTGAAGGLASAMSWRSLPARQQQDDFPARRAPGTACQGLPSRGGGDRDNGCSLSCFQPVVTCRANRHGAVPSSSVRWRGSALKDPVVRAR